jgi:hypothetical protein
MPEVTAAAAIVVGTYSVNDDDCITRFQQSARTRHEARHGIAASAVKRKPCRVTRDEPDYLKLAERPGSQYIFTRVDAVVVPCPVCHRSQLLLLLLLLNWRRRRRKDEMAVRASRYDLM